MYQKRLAVGKEIERAFAIAEGLRETPPPMPSRRAALPIVVLASLVGAAAAQPIPQDEGRTRLRDRYSKPQASAKLDDSLRKVKGEDLDARLEAIQNLGQLTSEKKAVDALLECATDPDMRIRIKAIDTLGNAQVKDATSLLVQQLFLRDTELATKQHILAALGKIGDPRATGPLLDFVARDIDPAVRGNAVFALGDIGDRAAVPPLETLAADGHDENLRRLAREAVRKIRERPQPPVVPPALAVDRRGPGASPQTP